jgi:Flp pilus assembly protein TadG
MIHSFLRQLKGRENGQMLVMAALTMAVVLGAAGLSVDVGFMMHTRTDLQKSADAMALAGAQMLDGTSGGESSADTVARTYGPFNGVANSDIQSVQFGTSCDPDPVTSSAHDLITVRLRRHQASFFARAVGFNGADIGACATAKKSALGALNHVRPFGLEDTCIANINYGNDITLKFDSATTRNCDSFQGNYGALTIDGTGASIYRDTIEYGSTSTICADVIPGCNNYLFATQTGNMIGPTKTGIDYLINNTPSSCNSWDKVQSNGKLTPACDPWAPGFPGVSRVFVVPVVHGMWISGGTNTIHVKRFAIVFLEGFSGNCTGNNCDVKARFIKETLTVPGATKYGLTPNADVTSVAIVK